MSHRHVVVCDSCGKESEFESFGMWVRISMGGEILPATSVDLCGPACLVDWLHAEAERREAE